MTTSVTTRPGPTRRRAAVQLGATVTGAVFLVAGILGFVPGITTGVGGLGFAGLGSQAFLLGLFQVSILHNLVHVLFGIAGLILGRTPAAARSYLVWGGAIYLVLFTYGLVDGAGSLNFVPLNAADNVLHFVIGAGMVVAGVVLGRRRAASHA